MFALKYCVLYRPITSSLWPVFLKIDVLKILKKFIGKHLCLSLCLTNLQAMFPIWQMIIVNKKPHVFSLVMSNSWLKQWIVVQQSVSKAPKLFHYRQPFFLSGITKRQSCLLKLFWKTHWCFENLNIIKYFW